MSFTPGVRTTNRLIADQAVSASTTLVTIQNSATDLFAFSLPAGKVLNIVADIPFSTGATGGFKFQLTCASTPTDYSARFVVFDGTDATIPILDVQTSQAAFANAFALASNHLLKLTASIKANAATLVSLQFACNSAANAITALKGATIDLTQI